MMREFFKTLADYPVTTVFVVFVSWLMLATLLEGTADIVRAFGRWRSKPRPEPEPELGDFTHGSFPVPRRKP